MKVNFRIKGEWGMDFNQILKKYIPNPTARVIVVGALIVGIFFIGWKCGRALGGK